MNEISIFRTSVNCSSEIKKVKPLLDRIIGPENWNFDLEDCDNILRVYTKPSINSLLIEKIRGIGFECVELH